MEDGYSLAGGRLSWLRGVLCKNFYSTAKFDACLTHVSRSRDLTKAA